MQPTSQNKKTYCMYYDNLKTSSAYVEQDASTPLEHPILIENIVFSHFDNERPKFFLLKIGILEQNKLW